MQWIRENLFLTCIAGALVVCLGVCYFIKSGQVAGYTNEDMKPRKALARKLTGLSRKKPVNKDRMKKAKARLDEIRQERDEAASNVDVWNKKNYQVLELKATVGGQTKVYQAFPHDSELYQKYGLTSKFTNAYRIELYGALAELDLTSRATNTEIEALSATINKNIQSGRTVALRNVEHARRRSGKPKGKDRSDGGEQEETKPDGVSDEDWRLSRLTDADVLHEAREGALKKLMYKKSHTGMVYVSPETLAMVADSRRPDRKKAPVELDVIFHREIWSWKDAPATRLWEAQLNLWVSKDILSSIDATNQQSLRTAEGVRKANVPNAAIKSLEDIRITEKYLRARSTRGAANTKTKPDLTTRATTDDYEIVEYNFTVIMKSSYLPALMKNLMTRGEHTITNVSVVNVPDNPEGSQYFGTDPVNRVEIAGEVLFRAGWTRKIMPPETLDRRSANVPGTGTKEFPGQKNRDKNR